MLALSLLLCWGYFLQCNSFFHPKGAAEACFNQRQLTFEPRLSAGTLLHPGAGIQQKGTKDQSSTDTQTKIHLSVFLNVISCISFLFLLIICLTGRTEKVSKKNIFSVTHIYTSHSLSSFSFFQQTG